MGLKLNHASKRGPWSRGPFHKRILHYSYMRGIFGSHPNTKRITTRQLRTRKFNWHDTRWRNHGKWKCQSNLNHELKHYTDVIMGAMASEITSPTIVYSTRNLGADQRKHQSSASLAFVRGIHRGPVNSPHKWPVTRKMFPFDDVIITWFGDGMAPVWFSLLSVPSPTGTHEVFNSSSLDQIAAILADDVFRCIFLNETFCIFIRISLKFVLRAQLTISQHQFRQWLGTDQATSHYLNKCWPSWPIHTHTHM